MKPYALDPEAAAEIEEAIAFYESRAPGKGDEFRDTVEEGIRRIRVHPKAYPPYLDRFRKYVVPGFPYLIFYVEFDDHVWVAAVPHAKRQPNYWINRQP